MSEGRPSVIIHGGFHKTATTHIQRILKRNEKFLQRQGVRYVHHRETRKEFTVPVQLNGFYHLGIPRRRQMDDAALRAITSDFFSKKVQDAPKRLILSDENFAGHCGQCVRGGQLYTYRSEFMGTFAREIPFAVKEIHLAIRGYADFFAAAYVEFLRSLKRDTMPSRFVSEAQMRQDVLKNIPAWSDVLHDVLAAAPSAKIYVWRYEDYSGVEDSILSSLCGEAIEISRLKTPKSSRNRPTASGEAVKRMLSALEMGGLHSLVDQRVEIQNTYMRGMEWGRYDPWNPNEREVLQRAYEQDWERICADGRYHIVTPDREWASLGAENGN